MAEQKDNSGNVYHTSPLKNDPDNDGDDDTRSGPAGEERDSSSGTAGNPSGSPGGGGSTGNPAGSIGGNQGTPKN